MELFLTEAEKAVLRETVDKALNDLLMEIARTDNRKLRGMLKEREAVMKAVLERISSGERAA